MKNSVSGALRELLQAARATTRQPKLFATTAILLSLGIGISTALFSVAYGVLLRPLPFRGQNRIVAIWKADRENALHVGKLSYPEFSDWERQARAFSSMAAMPTTLYGYEVNWAGHGQTMELVRTPVSAGFFDVLGVRAALGRTFSPADDRAGAQPAAVLSNALWRTCFHADRSVIGTGIDLGGQQYTVIGVMPAGFDFPQGAQLWTPLGIDSGWMKRGATFLEVIGRLNPGVSVQQARAELTAVMARMHTAYPQYTAPGELPVVTLLPDYIWGSAKPAILLMWGASLLLLAIACCNIASLLVARVLLREREIAVRVALGATRGRLLRQFLAEGFALIVAGVAAGWFVARSLIAFTRAFAPAGIPRLSHVHLNVLSLLFACAAAGAIALIFGCVPAILIANRDLHAALGEGGARTTAARRGTLLRKSLLAAESMVATVLLSSAVLVAQNFFALQHVPLGFAPEHVITAQVRTQMDPQERNAFFTQLLEKVRSHAGVQAAGAILLRPFEGGIGWDQQYRTRGQAAGDALHNPTANLESITPGYFRAVGTPILAGRDFDFEDDDSHPRVLIVSASLARREFGSVEGALGKELGTARAATAREEDWRTIVGVVADAQYRRLGVAQGDIFLSFLQTSIPVRYLAVRTSMEAGAFASLLRQDVKAMDPSLAISKERPMLDLIAQSRSGPQFSALLFALFGVFAGLLACVGVYGLVSDSAVQRRREMAIRMALGAQSRRVVMEAVQSEIGVAALGGIAGVFISLGLGRLYAHLLYGLSGLRGMAVSSAGLAFAVLLCTSALSGLAPALKLTKIPLARLLSE